MQNLLNTIKLHAATQVASIGQPRHALVTSVDPVAHAVKVAIQPEGLESGWIPDATIAAGGLRIMCPSEIGSQVIVLPMEGDAEHPVVIGRVFDVANGPAASPALGRPVQPGEMAIITEKGAFIQVTSEGIFLGGDVHVDGSLTVTGDVRAGLISLQHHVHDGVQAGKALTKPPVSADG